MNGKCVKAMIYNVGFLDFNHLCESYVNLLFLDMLHLLLRKAFQMYGKANSK